MGTITESPTTTVRLTREASTALVKEARERFDNGAHELHCSDDQGQRVTIAACTEIIGRIAATTLSPWRWPSEQTAVGRQELIAEFELSAPTVEWIKTQRDEQAPYVEGFATGVNGDADPGVEAQQVYLLHVLRNITAQAESMGEMA